MTQTLRKRHSFPGRQAGALTLFTAVLVLALMALLMYYGVRVGIIEQRVSANEVQQKLAFHAAESAIDHATEYFFANSKLVTSAKEDVLADGTDGWLAAGNEHWRKCSDYTGDFDDESDPVEIAHPCRGESSDARRANSYFYYYDDPDLTGEDPYAVNIDTDSFLQDNQAVSVRAVLCVLVVDFNPATNGGVPVTGCTTDTSVEGTHLMVTFLAHGQSDCNNGTCLGEALISEPVSNYSALNGPPPNIPLTTRSNFEGLGTVEVVTNPNAGGVGVPISVWASNNSTCATHVTSLTAGGNWKTCEAHEYYGDRTFPEDLRCARTTCSCDAAEAISYTAGADDVIGIDMFWDANFPCDLFDYFFGVPRSNYLTVKNAASILDDCSSLGPDSSGLYWIIGECSPPAQTSVIGSYDDPVVIVAAGAVTSLNNNLELYGVMYVTDVEPAVSIAEISGNGDITFYGALVVDGAIKNFNGTLSLIYNQAAVARAHGTGNLGVIMGGWTDFPKCWHAAGAGCP